MRNRKLVGRGKRLELYVRCYSTNNEAQILKEELMRFVKKNRVKIYHFEMEMGLVMRFPKKFNAYGLLMKLNDRIGSGDFFLGELEIKSYDEQTGELWFRFESYSFYSPAVPKKPAEFVNDECVLYINDDYNNAWTRIPTEDDFDEDNVWTRPGYSAKWEMGKWEEFWEWANSKPKDSCYCISDLNIVWAGLFYDTADYIVPKLEHASATYYNYGLNYYSM